MYDQLYVYLTEAGILSDCQFGFRKIHSTTTALLDCTTLLISGSKIDSIIRVKTTLPGRVNLAE